MLQLLSCSLPGSGKGVAAPPLRLSGKTGRGNLRWWMLPMLGLTRCELVWLAQNALLTSHCTGDLFRTVVLRYLFLGGGSQLITQRLASRSAKQATYVCMYVCMHACMHACMYVCMYVRTYVCMYVCMYVCVYIYIYTYYVMYTCICIYVYMVAGPHAPHAGGGAGSSQVMISYSLTIYCNII